VIDAAVAERHESETLLAGEEARELRLLEEVPFEEDLAESLARTGALLQGTLDRLRREEAGSENQSPERRVWTLT
jgi:hypothetical protein